MTSFCVRPIMPESRADTGGRVPSTHDAPVRFGGETGAEL